MSYTALIIGSYIVTFLVGRLYGVIEARNIVRKIMDKYQ